MDNFKLKKKKIIKFIIVCIIYVIIVAVVAFISNKNKAEPPIGRGNTYTKQELDIFNEKFTNYQGIQKGTFVKTLITNIIESNATHEEEWQVSISGITTNINEALKVIKPKNKYKVEISFNQTMGIVNNIEITLVEENE